MNIKESLHNNQYIQPLMYFGKRPWEASKSNRKEYEQLKQQYDMDVENFLGVRELPKHVYQNDLRHQYASARFTQLYNPGLANALGNMHEVRWRFHPNNTFEDMKIDQINNRIGRNYGLRYPDIDSGELLRMLLNDHEKNRGYLKY